MTRVEKPSTEHPTAVDVLVDGTQHEIETLVELELAIEAMGEEKATLLKSYLEEDVAKAEAFLRDLHEGIQLLESLAGQWMLAAADPTRIDWLKLKQKWDKLD
jgi:hypothetical protein